MSSDLSDRVDLIGGAARSCIRQPGDADDSDTAARLVSGVVLLASGGMFPSTPWFFESIARAADRELPMEERLAAFGRACFEEGTDPSLWWRPPSKAASKIKDAVAGPLAIWWSGGSAPMLVVQANSTGPLRQQTVRRCAPPILIMLNSTLSPAPCTRCPSTARCSARRS